MQQVPLWEDSKNVSAASLNRDPLGTFIPVEFALPADAFQTSHDNHRDQVSGCSRSRPTYPASIIRMSSSCLSFALRHHPRLRPRPFAGGAQIASFAQTTTMPGEVSAEVSEPPHHRVIVTDSPDGLEFHFRAGRNVARTVLVVSLAAGHFRAFLGCCAYTPASQVCLRHGWLAGFFPDPGGHSFGALRHAHRRRKRRDFLAALHSWNGQVA